MFAAITWDLTSITEPLTSLGGALLTAAGLVIAGAIVVYGVIRGIRVLKRVFGASSN